MTAQLIERTDQGTRIEVFIPYGKSMLESEENIQAGVNEVGAMATGEALKNYDTDGSPIKMGGVLFYSKSEKVEKEYETPYGTTTVPRYVYQSHNGGKTFSPLDEQARIITSSTPRFAKIVSHKYSDKGASGVQKDLEISNGRKVARSFIQNVSEAVGAIALAKEESWSYHTPKLEKPVHSISLGLDGTCMPLKDDGYREAMTGTLTLYDKAGERLHTTYIAATPEYGKEKFFQRFESEIKHIKQLYPKTIYLGLADGASANWTFLKKYTSVQTIDFYHVCEYVGSVASAVFKNKDQREEWLSWRCHVLKHKQGAPRRILDEMIDFREGNLSKDQRVKVQTAITYFRNHLAQMKYARNTRKCLPIGSGVTEAACKVIVKQRLCASGMKWKECGARMVLTLRCLATTVGRWDQFWANIDKYGSSCVA